MSTDSARHRLTIKPLLLLVGISVLALCIGLATNSHTAHAASRQAVSPIVKSLTRGSGPQVQKASAVKLANCPPAGIWPDPDFGPTYLNRYTDGNCSYYIAPNTFTSETLSSDHQTYYMEDQIHVATGGTLTVESGVTLEDQNAGNISNKNGGDLLDDGTITFAGGSSMQFGCQCGIYVSTMTTTQGVLNLNGSTLTPVTLSSGAGSLPGSWAGILFQHGGTGNLSNAHISGAGSGLQCFCGLRNAGIAIDNTSLTISNTTIDLTAGNGIEVSNGSVPTLSGDSVTNSTQYAVQYDFLTTNLPLISGLSLSGNKYNVVRIAAAAASSYTGQVKWPNLGAPLRIDNVVSVAQGATLTVDPGTTVQFGKADTLFVKGTLLMQGTASSTITLTSEMSIPAPGDWSSLDFEQGSKGTLAFVDVSYGGALTQCGCGNRYTDITIDGASPSISFSKIENSAVNGIEVSGSASPVFTTDVFMGNKGFPLQYDFLPPTFAHIVGIVVSGDGSEVIHMAYSGVQTYWTGTVTWPNLLIPLRFDGSVNVHAGATLNVASGAQIQFGKAAVLGVYGTLKMNGKSGVGKGITVTSAATTQAPGDWGGIDFERGSSGNLTYVQVSYAGGLIQCGCGNRYTSINIDGSSPTISNTTIQNSAGNDVEISVGSLPILHNDRFQAVPTGKYGVVVDGWTSGKALVDATNDWWNDKTGPYNPQTNPNGKGVPVSAGVSFTPWLTK